MVSCYHFAQCIGCSSAWSHAFQLRCSMPLSPKCGATWWCATALLQKCLSTLVHCCFCEAAIGCVFMQDACERLLGLQESASF